jgi:hypothetical protein
MYKQNFIKIGQAVSEEYGHKHYARDFYIFRKKEHTE